MTKFIFGILLALVCPASAQEGSVSWTSSPPVGDASIDTAKMAPDSVAGASILNGTIQSVDVANLTIDSTKLAALSVDSEKIAKGAVNSEKILEHAVDTGKLHAQALLDIAKQAAVSKLGIGVVQPGSASALDANSLVVAEIKGSGILYTSTAGANGMSFCQQYSPSNYYATFGRVCYGADNYGLERGTMRFGLRSAHTAYTWGEILEFYSDLDGGTKFNGTFTQLTGTNTFVSGIGGQPASGGLGVNGSFTVNAGSVTIRGAQNPLKIVGGAKLYGANNTTDFTVSSAAISYTSPDDYGDWVRIGLGSEQYSNEWGVADMGIRGGLTANTVGTVQRWASAAKGGASAFGSYTQVSGTSTFVTGIGGQAATGGLGVVGTVTMLSSATVQGNAVIRTGNIDTNKIVMNVPATLGGADSAKIGIGTVNPIGHLHVMSGSADTATISLGDATHGGSFIMGTTSGCFECMITGVTFGCTPDADCLPDGTP